jgi:hypothetical protein
MQIPRIKSIDKHCIAEYRSMLPDSLKDTLRYSLKLCSLRTDLTSPHNWDPNRFIWQSISIGCVLWVTTYIGICSGLSAMNFNIVSKISQSLTISSNNSSPLCLRICFHITWKRHSYVI